MVLQSAPLDRAVCNDFLDKSNQHPVKPSENPAFQIRTHLGTHLALSDYQGVHTKLRVAAGRDAMRALTDNLNLILVESSGLRVARWATISAGIGALGGATYGILFAGFMILFRLETFSFFHIASYFAVCGMVAGFILGVWGGLLDGENATETTTEPCEIEPRIVAAPINRIADVDPMANSRRSPRPNRIAALSRYDRKNLAAMTSKSPLRN